MFTEVFMAETLAEPSFLQRYASLILMIGIFAIFYFLIIRPQKKKEQEVRQMRSQLKIGDKITTIGGIFGKIISIKEDFIVIETGDNKTQMTITKHAVGNVESKK